MPGADNAPRQAEENQAEHRVAAGNVHEPPGLALRADPSNGKTYDKLPVAFYHIGMRGFDTKPLLDLFN
ncbi:MAG TPA: hypothetical protein VF182_24610 [Candidatus Binatia bacterium]